jgi:hypothetical protein
MLQAENENVATPFDPVAAGLVPIALHASSANDPSNNPAKSPVTAAAAAASAVVSEEAAAAIQTIDDTASSTGGLEQQGEVKLPSNTAEAQAGTAGGWQQVADDAGYVPIAVERPVTDREAPPSPAPPKIGDLNPNSTLGKLKDYNRTWVGKRGFG